MQRKQCGARAYRHGLPVLWIEERVAVELVFVVAVARRRHDKRGGGRRGAAQHAQRCQARGRSQQAAS
jgi:hypothetical protein